jgi:hypothetical protein
MGGMSDIQDALLRIYRLEGDPTDRDPLELAVTSPVAVAVKKVWPYFPPADKVVIDTPCFVNTYAVRDVLYESALRRVRYAVHARLVVYNSSSAEAAKIAASFQQPIIDRFGSNITLSGLSGWFVNTLRFENEQPVFFEDLSAACNKELYGLDFFIDLTNSKAASNAAGAAPSWA